MRLLFSILFLGISLFSFSQLNKLEGTWQGIITGADGNYSKGMAFWLDIEINADGVISGQSRIEVPFKEFYAIKFLKGKANNENEINLEENGILKEKASSQFIWCINNMNLSYTDSTGYLTGKYQSTDCNRQNGKILMYRSKYEMSKDDTMSMYHSWFNNLNSDLKRGWNAYYVREAELANFEILPVLFDHDMDIIKPHYDAYLARMVAIVQMHTDLRIKIIGHTDSNGTDEYNVDLSKRRAENIKAKIISFGLRPDRVLIEYRGEADPATSNSTSEGKRLNRRVDFEFI